MPFAIEPHCRGVDAYARCCETSPHLDYSHRWRPQLLQTSCSPCPIALNTCAVPANPAASHATQHRYLLEHTCCHPNNPTVLRHHAPGRHAPSRPRATPGRHVAILVRTVRIQVARGEAKPRAVPAQGRRRPPTLCRPTPTPHTTPSRRHPSPRQPSQYPLSHLLRARRPAHLPRPPRQQDSSAVAGEPGIPRLPLFPAGLCVWHPRDRRPPSIHGHQGTFMLHRRADNRPHRAPRTCFGSGGPRWCRSFPS